jgi:putative transposase
MQVGFVLEAMQRALRQAKPMICNSDQGSQFTSTPYINLLKEHEVQISMDGRGRALDTIFTRCGCGERLNTKRCNASDYSNPCEARQSLTEYLQFYNEHRIHQALDYQTPAELYLK